MFSNLEKSILKVICYFNVSHHPLTLMQIWKWLDFKADIFEIQQILNSERLNDFISEKNGFYFLNGREQIVDFYLKNYCLADKKNKKAILISGILKFFPWLKAIAIYSSVSFSNSDSENDIDLFVIAKLNRLWSCRFFINVFLKIFRLRPTRQSERDKICVSFLIAENSLDLSFLLKHQSDLNYIFGTSQFIFLYGRNKLVNDFFNQNFWLKDKLPNWFNYQVNSRRRLAARPSLIKDFLELIFSIIPEKFYQKIQLKIMPDQFKKINNLDGRVIIDNQIIKLHNYNKSQKLQQIFEEKFNQLLDVN